MDEGSLRTFPQASELRRSASALSAGIPEGSTRGILYKWGMRCFAVVQRASISNQVFFSVPIFCQSVFRGLKWLSFSYTRAVRWMSGLWATSYFEEGASKHQPCSEIWASCLPYLNGLPARIGEVLGCGTSTS